MKQKPELPYLTRHFSLAEMIVTKTGIDNWPTIEERARLRKLCQYLEKVRDLLGGSPITVKSAYRNEAVNRAVGGTPTSAHRFGYAADISVKGKTASSVARIIMSHGGFDQLIYEPSRGIVHVSIDPRMRGQVLTQRSGPRTALVPGIRLYA